MKPENEFHLYLEGEGRAGIQASCRVTAEFRVQQVRKSLTAEITRNSLLKSTSCYISV